MFIYPDCVILYCPLQSVCHILMGFVCVYLSRSCHFVLSPPVGMLYFNGTFCVYLSRLCYFVLSPLVGMSYFNGIFCVYLSRLCYFVLSPPVGMSYFNGIFCVYLSRLWLFCTVPFSWYFTSHWLWFVYPDLCTVPLIGLLCFTN